ncbi:MAG: roadblock/LC7 domain-containing protein [Gammaproteobacteria bacterium]
MYAAKLHLMLLDLKNSSLTVDGAVIVSSTGTAINSSLTEEHDQETIASLSAALYKHADQIMCTVQNGNQTDYVVVQCPHGYMVTTAIDGRAFLVIIIGSQNPLEQMLGAVDRVFQRHLPA